MSELDDLMNLDPLQLSEQDIERIIAYHRKNQANLEAGIKPKKAEGPKVDLMSLLKVKESRPHALPKMKRRF